MGKEGSSFYSVAKNSCRVVGRVVGFLEAPVVAGCGFAPRDDEATQPWDLAVAMSRVFL